MEVIDILVLMFMIGMACIVGGMVYDYKKEIKESDRRLNELYRDIKRIDFHVGDDDDEPGDTEYNRKPPEYGRLHIISNSGGKLTSYPIDLTSFESVRLPDGRTRYSCYSFSGDPEDDDED